MVINSTYLQSNATLEAVGVYNRERFNDYKQATLNDSCVFPSCANPTLAIACVFFSQRASVCLCQCCLWVGYLNHYHNCLCRALLRAGERRTPVIARTPSGLVAFDDSKMGGRHSEIQIRHKLFFQLSCNCLKVREKNFISSRLAFHGLPMHSWTDID